jgi:hypothetical protein
MKNSTEKNCGPLAWRKFILLSGEQKIPLGVYIEVSQAPLCVQGETLCEKKASVANSILRVGNNIFGLQWRLIKLREK